MRPPSAQDCMALLTRENQKFGIFIDLEAVNRTYYSCAVKMQQYADEIRKKFSVPSPERLQKVIIDTVKTTEFADLIPVTAAGKDSFAEPVRLSIIENMPNTEVAEMTDIYNKYAKLETKLSELNPASKNSFNLMEMSTFRGTTELPGYNNALHRIGRCEPLWENVQVTNRYTCASPAIGNMNKDFVKEILTVPAGYELWTFDSSQIEPRTAFSIIIPDKLIQYFINLYNDAYIGILHYASLSDEEIASGKMDYNPWLIDDKIKEKRQKLKSYLNGVIYGKRSNPNNDPDLANYIKRIGNHPLRLKYVEEAKANIVSGRTKVLTVFGTQIDLLANEWKHSDYSNTQRRIEDLANKNAINYRMQGTAADLNRIALVKAYELVHTYGKKSYILMTVHDSIKFAIHEDDKDTLLPMLNDCVAYDIDGWVKIPCEGEVSCTAQST